MSSEHFDAVVIGSGFGGSVMAYRLAEAGWSVCLLERGKPYPPNSFPRSPHAMSRNFWDPSEGLYGMFNVWSFRGSGAVVGSGLGGGSLIYANVLLRKDEAWFQEEEPEGGYWPWPVQYRDLEPHYERVERMMNAQRYPLAHSPYASTPKTNAWREVAAALKNEGVSWVPLNLAVSFRARPVSQPGEDDAQNPPRIGEPLHEPEGNLHGMHRQTCRLCGECDVGCNFGSKNSLDFTYLSRALRHGAVIRSLCEAKTIRPGPAGSADGYIVEYVEHDPTRITRKKPHISDPALLELKTLTCKRLILAAGTFGSTYLLFKNRSSLPGISAALGSRFSVNGDLLSFMVNAHRTQAGVKLPRPLDPSFGPVITGALRFGDALDGKGDAGRGFYVEDGGNPALASWAAEASGLGGYLRRLVHFVSLNLRYRLGLGLDTDLSAEIAAILGDAATSHSSLPLLTMGRDQPTGRLSFDGRYLECDWRERESRQYYDRVDRELRKVADILGATYADNPSLRWNFHQVLTAHPLGGCPMAESDQRGVVDSYGNVFGHPGLLVADGSILPGPVGANPSLTIAAVADRAADRLINEQTGRP